jgi:hypothetical protein
MKKKSKLSLYRDIFQTIKVIVIYSGKEHSVSQGAKFFKQKFLSQCKLKHRIISHVTCCTDTKTMNLIITSMLMNPTEHKSSVGRILSRRNVLIYCREFCKCFPFIYSGYVIHSLFKSKLQKN